MLHERGECKNMKNKKEKKQEEEELTGMAAVWDYLKTFLIIFCVVFAMNKLVYINAVIPSESMQNTIMKGDRVLGNRLAYIKDDPERYDIVIFKYPDDPSKIFIKRVIGLPGETVTVKDGKIYIDGKLDAQTVDILDMRYLVMRIDEPDFGCEGRPDGVEPMAKVTLLKLKSEEEIQLEIPDAELYQKEINEGNEVAFSPDGVILKLS